LTKDEATSFGGGYSFGYASNRKILLWFCPHCKPLSGAQLYKPPSLGVVVDYIIYSIYKKIIQELWRFYVR